LLRPGSPGHTGWARGSHCPLLLRPPSPNATASAASPRWCAYIPTTLTDRHASSARRAAVRSWSSVDLVNANASTMGGIRGTDRQHRQPQPRPRDVGVGVDEVAHRSRRSGTGWTPRRTTSSAHGRGVTSAGRGSVGAAFCARPACREFRIGTKSARTDARSSTRLARDGDTPNGWEEAWQEAELSSGSHYLKRTHYRPQHGLRDQRQRVPEDPRHTGSRGNSAPSYGRSVTQIRQWGMNEGVARPLP
jgi:hypothetical protein